MAENRNPTFTQAGEARIKSEIRDHSQFLPAVHRTESLTRFFKGAVDHALSSGTTESLDAYWGRRLFNSGRQESWHSDSDSVRNAFQLAPASVSRRDGKVESAVPYAAWIRRFEQAGGDADSHDRAFSEPGYVLDVPIDLDKFVNHSMYHWLPDGPPHVVIEPVLHGSGDFTIGIEGSVLTVTMRNGRPHHFEAGDRVKLAGFAAGGLITSTMATAIGAIDGTDADDTVVTVPDEFSFTVNLGSSPGSLAAKTAPGTGSVSGFIDMALVDGARAFTTGPVQYTAPLSGGGTRRIVSRIKFENGLRVAFREDSVNSRFAGMPSEVTAGGLDSTIATDTVYEVRGIGREGITFCADQPLEMYPSVSLGPKEIEGAGTKSYAVQGRRADGRVNPWIIRNRWVRESVVETAIRARHLSHRNLVEDETRAKRPIIEFDSGMRTWQGTSADGHSWDGPLVTAATSGAVTSASYAAGTLTWIEGGDDRGLYRYVAQTSDSFEASLKPNKVGPVSRAAFPSFDVFLSGDSAAASSVRAATDNDFEGEPVFRYRTDPDGKVDPELGFAPVIAADGTPMFEWTLGNRRYHRNQSTDDREEIEGFYYWRGDDGALRNGWSAVRGGQRVPIVRTAESDGKNPVEFDLGTADLSHPAEWIVTNDGNEIRWHSNEAGLIDLGSPNPDVAMEAGAEQSVTFIPAQSGESLSLPDYTGANATQAPIADATETAFTPPAVRPYDLERQYSAGAGNAEKTGRIHVLDRNMRRVTVRHDGKWLDDSKWSVSSGVLTLAEAVPAGDAVSVEYVTDADVAGAEYAVAPVHFFNNASDPFTEASGREMSEHFESQMVRMPGFAGNPHGGNSYSEIPRLHAYGGTIRQQWVDTLKLMHLMDIPAANPIRGLRTVAADYATFLRHFRSKTAQMWRDEGFSSVRALVDRVLGDIHAGKDAAFRYAGSDMAYWRNFDEEVHDVAYSRDALKCALPSPRNDYGGTRSHLQVHLETNGVERILAEGTDFAVEGGEIVLTDSGNPLNTSRTESFPAAVNVGAATNLAGTASTNTVRVNHAGHGFESGDAVAFSGLAASSNQSFLDGINGNVFAVTRVDEDSFTFSMDVSGDVTIPASALNGAGTMQVRNRVTLSAPVTGDPVAIHVRGNSRTRLESGQFSVSGTALTVIAAGANAVSLESGDTFEVYSDLESPKVRIRRFPHSATSFIPPSSVKLGFFKPTQVEASGREIVGHDGTRHEVETAITAANEGDVLRDTGSASFDPVAAALFELEMRISQNLVDAHHSQEDMAAMLPSAHRSDRRTPADTRKIAAERFNVWAAANGVSIDGTAYDASDPFTWNYDSVEAGTGSWRALYHHHFGTDRPHTHPWEMLGHRIKPSWWDTHYSWTDGNQAKALIAALRHGIVGEPPASGVGEVDARFARHSYDWSSSTLVTAAGVLNDPVAAGVVSAPSAADAAVPFKAGEWSEEEDAWRKGPEYPFAVAETLLRLRPFMAHAMWWRLGRLEEESAWNGQWRDSGTMGRRGCPEMHNQLLEDGIVAEIAVEKGGSGYGSDAVMDFPQADGKCERAAGAAVHLAGGEVAAVSVTDPGRGYRASPTDVQPEGRTSGGGKIGSGAVVEYTMDYAHRARHFGFSALCGEMAGTVGERATGLAETLKGLSAEMAVHLGGFVDGKSLSVETDGNFDSGRTVLPKTQSEVTIGASPAGKSVFYSGVRITRLSGDRFQVDGFDRGTMAFMHTPPSLSGRSATVTVGNAGVTEYANYHSVPVRVPYGTVFTRRQSLHNFLMGLGNHYAALGFDLPDWADMAREAIGWTLGEGSPNDEWLVSGTKGALAWNGGSRGAVAEIGGGLLGETGIVDREHRAVSAQSVFALRDGGRIELQEKVPAGGIFGVALEMEEISHVAVLRSAGGLPGTEVYSPVMGRGAARARLLGQRAKDWSGRIGAPGYLVRAGGMIPSVESGVRELEHDWIHAQSKTLNPLTRDTMGYNFGYSMPDYMADSGVGEVSARMHDMGERGKRGTRDALLAMGRSRALTGEPFEGKVREHWMVSKGGYGDVEGAEPLEFTIDPAKIKGGRQIVRLNADHGEDDPGDFIIDVHERDVVNGDHRNPFEQYPFLPADNRSVGLAEKFQKVGRSSGMLLRGDVDYFVNSIDGIGKVYDSGAAWATVANWSKSNSYQRGDVVRHGGRVHRLVVDSTGINRVSEEVVIRGSEVSPSVPNDRTLILNGSTVKFSKSSQVTTTDAITVIGNSDSVSFKGPKTLYIDVTSVKLEKTGVVNGKVLDGTIRNPTVQNSATREIKIDHDSDGTDALSSFRVKFDEERDYETAREVWTDLFTEAKKVTADLNVTARTRARLSAFEDLRSDYISAKSSAEWRKWLDEKYFGFTRAIPRAAEIAINETSKTMTVSNWANHGYMANQKLTFSDVNGVGSVYSTLVRNAINGTHEVVSVPDANSFTITLAGTPPAMVATATTSGRVTKETPDRIVNPEAVANLVKDHIELSGSDYVVKSGDDIPDWATSAHAYLANDIDVLGEVAGESSPADRNAIHANAKIGTALPANFAGILDNANSESFDDDGTDRKGLLGDAGVVAFAQFAVDNPTTKIEEGTKIPVPVSASDRYKIDGVDDIVRKINAAAPAGISALKQSDGSVRIRMDGADESRLVFDSADDSDLGFTRNQRGVKKPYSVQQAMDAEDVADMVNDSEIPGVTASTNNGRLVIVSTNRELEIGNGTANADVGFRVGSYRATVSRPSVFVDLDIGDVVEQINDAEISGLTAEPIDGALVIRFDGDELVVGGGSANEILGISAGTFASTGEIVENTFNSADWEPVAEPADFSILVVNTIGSDGVAPTSSADYDILRTIDLELDVEEICAGTEHGDDALVKTDRPHTLTPGERVLILNSSSSPGVDGIHKVTRVTRDASPRGFFIDRSIREKGFDGKVIPIRSVKFANTEAVRAVASNPKYVNVEEETGISSGALLYAERESVTTGTGEGAVTTRKPSGAVYAAVRSGRSFYTEKMREERPKTRNDKFSGAVLRSVRSGRTVAEYEVFDPLKGIIPKAAAQAIDLRSDRDAAVYSGTTDLSRPTDEGGRWGREQVGTVWWDLSTAIYYDYEQGELAERREFWGRLLPGSSIDVYQWTRSPVPPDDYAQAVSDGTVVDGEALSGTAYSFTTPAGDVHRYWCEDLEINPRTGRLDTVYYFWVGNKIAPGAGRRLSVTQIASLIRDPSGAGIDWFAATGTSALILGNLDRYAEVGEMAMQVRTDEAGAGRHREWILLKECDPEDRVPQWLHDGLRDSLAGFTRDVSTKEASAYSGTATYAAGDVVKHSGSYWECGIAGTAGEAPSESSGNWTGFDVTDEFVKGEYAGESGHWLVEHERTRPVPDPSLHPLARVGNGKRPNQTWFRDPPAARRAAFEEINAWLARTNLSRDFPDWDTVFGESISRGTRTVDVGETWERIDWTDPEAPAFDPAAPDHRVDSEGGLAALPATEGQTAWVEAGREIRMLSGGRWRAVWKKAGTAMFRESLWDSGEAGEGWGSRSWGREPWGESPGFEIAEILDLLRGRLWTGDWECFYSDFWFRMLRHIVSEQRDVEWIVKSGYFEYEIEGSMLRRTGAREGHDLSGAFAHATAIKPFTSKIKEMTDLRRAETDVDVDVDTGVSMTFQTTLKGMTDTVVDGASAGNIMVLDNYGSGTAWFPTDIEGDFSFTYIPDDTTGSVTIPGSIHSSVNQSAVGIPELKVAGNGSANQVLMRSTAAAESAGELTWGTVNWSFRENTGYYKFGDVTIAGTPPPADNQILLHDGRRFANVTVTGAMVPAAGTGPTDRGIVFADGKIEQSSIRTNEGYTGAVATKVVQVGASGRSQSLTFEPGYIHSAINDVIVEVDGNVVSDGFTIGSNSITFEGASGFGSGFSAGAVIKVYVANSLSGAGKAGQVLIGNGRGGYEWRDSSEIEYGLQDIDDVAAAGASQYSYGSWGEVSGVSGTDVDFNSTSLQDGVGIFTALASGEAGRRPTRPSGGDPAKWWEFEGAYAVWTEDEGGQRVQRILAAANEYFWLRKRTRPADGTWGNWGDWLLGAGFPADPTDDEARRFREITFDETGMTSGRPAGPWVVDMADAGIADRPPARGRSPRGGRARDPVAPPARFASRHPSEIPPGGIRADGPREDAHAAGRIGEDPRQPGHGLRRNHRRRNVEEPERRGRLPVGQWRADPEGRRGGRRRAGRLRDRNGRSILRAERSERNGRLRMVVIASVDDVRGQRQRPRRRLRLLRRRANLIIFGKTGTETDDQWRNRVVSGDFALNAAGSMDAGTDTQWRSRIIDSHGSSCSRPRSPAPTPPTAPPSWIRANSGAASTSWTTPTISW